MNFKMRQVRSLLLAFVVVFGVAGCSSIGDRGAVLVHGRSGLAKRVLHNPKISLMTKQVSGRVDDATAYRNIEQAANGGKSRRSVYQGAPGGWIHLDPRMLRAMWSRLRAKPKRRSKYIVISQGEVLIVVPLCRKQAISN